MRFLRLPIGALLFPCLASGALATTYGPVCWEEIVHTSDLVLVVECETAGAGVARFRIVESWKGGGEGSSLAMALPVDGNRLSVALCGRRYLVAADRGTGSFQVLPNPEGGSSPPLWRRLPAEAAIGIRVDLPVDLGDPWFPILEAQKID